VSLSFHLEPPCPVPGAVETLTTSGSTFGEQTGFQTAEFILQHGFVDRIVLRPDLRREIARIIDDCGK